MNDPPISISLSGPHGLMRHDPTHVSIPCLIYILLGNLKLNLQRDLPPVQCPGHVLVSCA